MADLAKVHVGDELRIPLKVAYKDEAIGAPVKVVYKDSEFWPEFWLSREEVEAAEHIPALKVFKRGDWVRHQSAQYRGISYKGVVVADGLGILTVSWNHDPMTLLAVAAADLEPDEAPE